jgi:hypothetical protein
LFADIVLLLFIARRHAERKQVRAAEGVLAVTRVTDALGVA